MRRLIATSLLALSCLTAATAAHATLITYLVDLSGPNEFPTNASPGTGDATITIDDVVNTMFIDMAFSGLTAGTTASHIHCCTALPGVGTAGVATQTPFFVGFPIGVTSGTYSHTFDLTLTSTYNGSFVGANGGTAAGAEAALLAGMAAGEAYLNIHTSNFLLGEIRGFLVADVPEPASLLIMTTGMLALGWARRRTRR